MKRLVVEMEDKLHTAIKIEALKQGVSAKDYIIALIKKRLRNKKSKHSNFGERRVYSRIGYR